MGFRTNDKQEGNVEEIVHIYVIMCSEVMCIITVSCSTLLYGGQVVIYSTLWWARHYLLYFMVGKTLFTLLYGAPHELKRRGQECMGGKEKWMLTS